MTGTKATTHGAQTSAAEAKGLWANGAGAGADQVHRSEDGFTLLVGTFRSPAIYTLQFQPPAPTPSASFSSSSSSPSNSSAALTVSHKSPAAGGHSWLSLSPSHTHLYATVWASPPTVAAYALDARTKQPTLLNTAPVASLSGYVVPTPSGSHLLSVGGPSGEVLRLCPATGAFLDPAAPVQRLSFRRGAADSADDGRREGVAHGDFGGLRWGSHSVDISPDGRAVYVADIGHNCIWSFALDERSGSGAEEKKEGEQQQEQPLLTLRGKHVSPRENDGPRHCWPHPNGRVVYCVQEHSGMVDAFAEDGTGLVHMHGFSLLPQGKAPGLFWADEVRTSNLPGHRSTTTTTTTTTTTALAPRWLYASTRGLDKGTKGYVAVFELDEHGAMVGPAVEIYETRTSGGLANAVEPAPRALYEQMGVDWRRGEGEGEEQVEEYVALTDSEDGWVVVLGWNGRRLREVAAVQLEGAQAATAVWV
ncbi:unnamed protein product [Discula destructiva]